MDVVAFASRAVLCRRPTAPHLVAQSKPINLFIEMVFCFVETELLIQVRLMEGKRGE
jgi:hypothetical protein